MPTLPVLFHRWPAIAAILLPFLLPAQTDPDSLQATSPFVRNRLLANVRASINSSSHDGIALTGDQQTFSNTFSFELGLGFLVAERFALGGSIQASRQNSEGIFNRESELLMIGPFCRYFLSDNPRGSLYPRLGIGYARFFERNSGAINTLPFDRTLRGGGLGLVPGLGYTYVLKNLVGFDIGINYQLIFIDGQLADSIEESTEGKNFTGATLSFSFGFILLLN